MIADGLGRAVAFILAPSQAHQLPHAIPLIECVTGVPKWVVADQGYASHAFRGQIWNRGARPAIPPKRNEAPVACPAWIYNNRNQVERLWARLKEWRAIATRYEKTASSFIGVLALAAALDWLKSSQAVGLMPEVGTLRNHTVAVIFQGTAANLVVRFWVRGRAEGLHRDSVARPSDAFHQ
ncbi:UNVERIFIED_ORG: transposase [Methylobacterium sp. SuP10 SLI 274]|nr:transposase [Methylorubrum extorquens]MDF9791542.1 transposase [Methylorubrum extorquens]MDF9863234.1 transposase [Methylorubrum pseudosasae]MDH6636845.1 transposase [Methylobacterium sp. SuP10 SLI 274]MDH6666022.1 transposase [Methylorubrum zatmanii]